MFSRTSPLFKAKSIRQLGQIAFVAMFVLVSLVLSAQAASLTVTKTASKGEQAAASAYWTRSRIANAPAMQMLIDRGSGEVDAAAALAAAAETGEGESEPPGMPDLGAAGVAQAAYAKDWKAVETDLLAEEAADVPTGTGGTYTYYDVNVNQAFWKVGPHMWSGKLTFSTPSGNSSCSATVISNNNIVTAAHCVYDTTANRWYSNFVFTPAYRNGSAPYGTFAWQSATILNAWINLSGNFSINTWTRYDVAVLKMKNNSAGQTLNAVVGYAGRRWNAGYNQLNFNSGYPAQNYNLATISSPAQYLRACVNESFTQTTDTLGGGCYWGPGISGGSWLVDYRPFIFSGYVNSVNSGLFVGQQNIYGARFNSSNIVPLCNSSGC